MDSAQMASAAAAAAPTTQQKSWSTVVKSLVSSDAPASDAPASDAPASDLLAGQVGSQAGGPADDQAGGPSIPADPVNPENQEDPDDQMGLAGPVDLRAEPPHLTKNEDTLICAYHLMDTGCVFSAQECRRRHVDLC